MCFTSRLSKLCICLLLIACASVAQAMEVNINFLLGEKGLDNDEWGAAALGVEADSQPVFGVRKIWRTGKARPFVGGGFGIIGGAILGLLLGWGWGAS